MMSALRKLLPILFVLFVVPLEFVACGGDESSGNRIRRRKTARSE